MDREGQRERLMQARKERLLAEEKKKKTRLDKNELKAVTLWGVYFQVAKASNVLQARKAGSKKKEAVLKTAQVNKYIVPPPILTIDVSINTAKNNVNNSAQDSGRCSL